jgi:hypothetical protein
MNKSELALLMLEYERAQAQADALRAVIEAEVMELGETVKAGNVTASYSGGRKSYNYAGILAQYDEVALEPWTTIVPATVKVDYRAACKGLGIQDVPFTQSPPSVTVKVA